MMSEGKYAPVAATTSHKHWRTAVAVALGLLGMALLAWSGAGALRGPASPMGMPAAAATRMSVGLSSKDCGCTGKGHACVGKCPGWTDPKGKADCVWQCGEDLKTCTTDCANAYTDEAKSYVRCADEAKSCLLACKDDPSTAQACVRKCHDDHKLCD